VHVEDLDISPSKIGETAQRIVDRAIEEARRREHALLTNEHVFLAFAQVEWDTFAEVMRDIELNPHTILQAIEEHLHMMPSFAGRELRVSPATKLVFKLALHHASRAGSLRAPSPVVAGKKPSPASRRAAPAPAGERYLSPYGFTIQRTLCRLSQI